jgi:nucleotide-binding universal stress UspA family protein
MNKIVVGVDGSEASVQALIWAAHQAARRDATLKIVSCYMFPMYVARTGYPGDADIVLDADGYRDAADAVVDRAVDLVAEIDEGLDVERLTEMMVPVTGLVEAAGPEDEIVVGAVGSSGIVDGLLGSVASGVLHRARVPVVVVPAKPADSVGESMRKIVVGVDGSRSSLEALDWAFGLAAASGAELNVVHSWIYPYQGPRTSITEPRDLMQLDAMETLDHAVHSLGARVAGGAVKVHAKLVESSPVQALLDEGSDADLIVVGSRGRGGLRSMLLGSVSRSIVDHAPCAVAVVRQGDD